MKKNLIPYNEDFRAGDQVPFDCAQGKLLTLLSLNSKPLMKKNLIPYNEAFRAGDQVRTGDIQLGRLTLYQLSYSRISVTNI